MLALAERAQTRIVLCMIVKNEAAIIRRCLKSALPHVDGYCICDTGSSDGTPRVIAETAAAFGRPGRVVQHAFRDFGYNRTLSVAEARAWVTEQGWPLEQTYLLFLDADMVLHVAPGFDKRALSATYYSLIQDNGCLRYHNIRLACLSHDWRAVGPTHEYWQPTGETAAEPGSIDTMWIHDIGNGGSKANKFSRDIFLLRRALSREPHNPRYAFYLAQSYYDVGRFAEAAEWYQRRCRSPDFPEERWYARYRRGLCFLRMRQGERAAGILLEAYDERPWRAEPLWALARHYREQGKNQLAYMLARKALDIPYPAGDVLFIEKQVYDWQLWEEIMISAYYVGAEHHDLGFEACERLLLRRGHDAAFYDYVAGNEVFYLKPLAAVRRGTFQLPDALRDHDGVPYSPANPTLVRYEDAVYVNVRLLNYDQTGGRGHTPRSPDDRFRTRNVRLRWDPEHDRAPDVVELPDVPADWPKRTRQLGLEDMRWIEHEGRVWFTATCYQIPEDEDRCRVALGRLDPTLERIDHLVGFKFAEARSLEKNWLLWSRSDGLFVIHSYDPFLVLRMDPVTGEATPAQSIELSWRAERLRGSCPPIPIPGRGGRYLAMVHEVAYRPEGNVYSHRWLEIDERAGPVALSRPFVFDHVGVEYAVGCLDRGDGKLIVTYGFEDREARWIELEWPAVLDTLRPVGSTQ